MINYTGLALVVPATLPIALDVFARAGYSQTAVAGASSAVFTIIICSGNALGPPLGGLMVSAFGLPMTNTIYFLVTAVIGVPMTGVLVWKYAKAPEKGCASKDGCAGKRDEEIAGGPHAGGNKGSGGGSECGDEGCVD